MKSILLALTLGLLLLHTVAFAKEGAFPGKHSQWKGFARYDFKVDGRKCIVVAPKNAAEGKPWVWRARFFGEEPQSDIALLKRGFHLAYMDLIHLFGSPSAVEHGNAFYDYLDREHFFSPKPVLFGFSRGGLFALNWAAANPEKVSCIYADAPVCDFKSWPLGQGAGKRLPKTWQACLDAYQMTEREALAYNGNPIDQLKPLTDHKIPLLVVVGDADKAVPVSENTAIVEKRYQALGGKIKVIHKPNGEHHPHSLKNPKPIVDFVLKHTQTAKVSGPPVTDRNIHLNEQYFQNCRARFLKEKKGHVAFMGGSITEMEGYRPLIMDWLEKRFPETEFTFTNAGISSTCSTTGAFRLKKEVLEKGSVDLLFVEFAVNDDQDARHAQRECIRGMEGIVRQMRTENPKAEIVMTHFINPAMLKILQKGETPLTAAAHSEVAKHYGVSVNNLAKEVADRITAGTLDWDTFGGTHPKKPGNQLCAEMIQLMLTNAWKEDHTPAAYAIPESMDPRSYAQGHFLDLKEVDTSNGWVLGEPQWARIRGNKRDRFVGVPMLHAEKPRATFSLTFEGQAVGAYLVAGPDAGIIEGSVDGKPFAPVDTFHRNSRGLHYPRTLMFATSLAPGKHTLEIRISDSSSSAGHAVRILQLVAN